jgi:hypothetical protein
VRTTDHVALKTRSRCTFHSLVVSSVDPGACWRPAHRAEPAALQRGGVFASRPPRAPRSRTPRRRNGVAATKRLNVGRYLSRSRRIPPPERRAELPRLAAGAAFAHVPAVAADVCLFDRFT